MLLVLLNLTCICQCWDAIADIAERICRAPAVPSLIGRELQAHSIGSNAMVITLGVLIFWGDLDISTQF